MNWENEQPMRMVLHACCGPCSLEPVRVLRERGVEPHIYYANSNIAPADEYRRRLDTLSEWALRDGVAVTEGVYRPEEWTSSVGKPWSSSSKDEAARRERCRGCYRLRFEESAAWAKSNGFDAMGTTLSVSPYQYTDIIREELERACEANGLQAAFEDYRPYYDEATRRSRSDGMYRQNYCGCAISNAEAASERAERKAAREAERERWRCEHANELAADEAARESRRAERRAYDEKRARQKAVLRELRGKCR